MEYRQLIMAGSVAIASMIMAAAPVANRSIPAFPVAAFVVRHR
jgi:hypothetical protein